MAIPPIDTSQENAWDDSPETVSAPFPSPRPKLTSSGSLAQLYEEPFDEHCVLSFDGGGIRGYSSLIILQHLMEKIKEVELRDNLNSSFAPGPFTPCVQNGTVRRGTSPDLSKEGCGECCRYLPCHYFDFIGGTSTGGLISIMLGRLRMSVKSCIEEYRDLSKDVFGNPRLACMRGPIPWPRDKYDGKSLQRAVEKVVMSRMSKDQRQVGAGNFKSPPGLCRILVFAYADKISNNTIEYMDAEVDKIQSDEEHGAPYLFRSYDHWGSNDPTPSIFPRNPGPAHSLPIWQVARATTAAPMYFSPIPIANRKFGDGGFGTNNPTEEIFWEVNAINGGDARCVKMLLSIGTGEDKIKRFGEGRFAKYAAYFHAMRRLASESKKVHENMMSMKAAWTLPYFRFDVPHERGLQRIKLDECRPDTMDKIEQITNRYCKEIEKEMLEVAEILVRQRKRRARSDLWPLVSTGKQYRCTVERCHRSQELVPRKEDLRAHYRNEHSDTPTDLEELVRKGSVSL